MWSKCGEKWVQPQKNFTLATVLIYAKRSEVTSLATKNFIVPFHFTSKFLSQKRWDEMKKPPKIPPYHFTLPKNISPQKSKEKWNFATTFFDHSSTNTSQYLYNIHPYKYIWYNSTTSELHYSSNWECDFEIMPELQIAESSSPPLLAQCCLISEQNKDGKIFGTVEPTKVLNVLSQIIKWTPMLWFL